MEYTPDVRGGFLGMEQKIREARESGSSERVRRWQEQWKRELEADAKEIKGEDSRQTPLWIPPARTEIQEFETSVLNSSHDSGYDEDPGRSIATHEEKAELLAVLDELRQQLVEAERGRAADRSAADRALADERAARQGAERALSEALASIDADRRAAQADVCEARKSKVRPRPCP